MNEILRGNTVDVMNGLPEKSVDLIVTSPPYNIGGFTKNKHGKWPGAKLADGYDNYDDSMPDEKYVEWQRTCIDSMMRLLADDGAIFYNHKYRIKNGLLQDRSEIVDGFPVRQIIIWWRDGGINFNTGYFLPTYEVIYLIAKPDFKLNLGASGVGDVWRISQEQKNEHPAPFPLELPMRCIKATNSKIILDPFCGSGTTLLAAKLLKRKYIGIDISEKYCELARKRVMQEPLI